MNTQSTRCADEELAELEEWLQSKGMSLVDKSGDALEPGEYVKKVDEPRDPTGGGSPVWIVTWHPAPE